MANMNIHPGRHPNHYPNFLKHFAGNLRIGLIVTLIVLAIGMAGYRYFEKSEWIDAYANAAMIISGVGTLTNPQTTEGKFFVATFSLLGGGTFLIVIGVIFAPIFHWFLRKFHIEDRDHF